MPEATYSVQPINGEIDDEFDQFSSIAAEGLLVADRTVWQQARQRVGNQNFRGVFDSKHQLAGGLGLYRMGHWFGGREVRCAGVTAVAISPVYRGSGACKALLTQTLRELFDDGTPIASLYPSTQRLYRSVGFEQAGSRLQYSMPLSGLDHVDRELEIERFESPPVDRLASVAADRGRATNGNVVRTSGLWDRLIQTPYGSAQTFTYLLGPADQPEGYAIFASGDRQAGVPQPLIATDLAANTPAAVRQLWTLIRDHRGIRDCVKWCGGPVDPLLFAVDEVFVSVESHLRWMLRIVNVATAIAARGYDESVETDFTIQIHDALLPENNGRWRIEISSGMATATRIGSDQACQADATMDIRALAPLYSSFFTASQLARAGVIEIHRPDQLSKIDRVFAGPSPWTPEIF